MDRTLELLSTYACELTYEALPAEVVHQVKRTLIDTLGCAIGAFHAEPSRIARHLAESVTSRMPARVLGTRHASSPDMAGFANGVMVRYLDCNDSYFSPGGGHRCSPDSTLKKKKGQTSDQCGSAHHAIGGLAYAKTPGLGPPVCQSGLFPFSADQSWQHECHRHLSDPAWQTAHLPL
jgi:MmgE/PrpD N-terminal domain